MHGGAGENLCMWPHTYSAHSSLGKCRLTHTVDSCFCRIKHGAVWKLWHIIGEKETVSHRNYPESRMTFCDFLLKQKSSNLQRTSECVSCYSAKSGLCVCSVCVELFDVNKQCHCFVRPLSPKQHIISFFAGTFCSLCVFLCATLHFTCVYILFMCIREFM